MEEDKKTLITIASFFSLIGVVIILQIFLSIYLQSIY
jgi:hypothetical protein